MITDDEIEAIRKRWAVRLGLMPAATQDTHDVATLLAALYEARGENERVTILAGKYEDLNIKHRFLAERATKAEAERDAYKKAKEETDEAMDEARFDALTMVDRWLFDVVNKQCDRAEADLAEANALAESMRGNFDLAEKAVRDLRKAEADAERLREAIAWCSDEHHRGGRGCRCQMCKLHDMLAPVDAAADTEVG